MSEAVDTSRRAQDHYYACSLAIVDSLISAYDAQETVDLTRIRKEACKTYKLPSAPRIVDIISAIPREYKSKILPYLRSKPVRTASGIAVVAVMCKPHRFGEKNKKKTSIFPLICFYLTYIGAHILQ